MSVEEMEKEFNELAQTFWFSEVSIYDEVNKIRLKYPKEIRQEFCKRNPPNPLMLKVFAAALVAQEVTPSLSIEEIEEFGTSLLENIDKELGLDESDYAKSIKNGGVGSK